MTETRKAIKLRHVLGGNVIDYLLAIMSAKNILEAVRTLTSSSEMHDRVKSYEETIRQLIQRVEELATENHRRKDQLARLFKKMRCTDCNHYLESKLPGDTIEVHECKKVFLTHCWGTEP